MAGEFKINPEGVKDLLKSKGVQDDLKRRADKIASAAGHGFEAHVSVGPNRARAAVVTATPAAMELEERDRKLTKATDAGRSA